MNVGSKLQEKIDAALSALKNNRMIVVVDDEDRENEGDIICAAENITPDQVNFMALHARGLICVALPESTCHNLQLPLMVNVNSSLHETAFTISVDSVTPTVSTGISAYDRAFTIRALANPATLPEELGRPGHIFPLQAKENGVLRRAGHTEAGVDLMRLAGLHPAAVLVEIMNPDGTMARLPELQKFARKYNMPLLSVKDLISYRLQFESLVEQGTRVNLPTKYGHFEVISFRETSSDIEHIALVKGQWEQDETILVRVHSSCATGDLFGSLRCECGEQLHSAMRMIEEAGKGVIIYLLQEGRGIGLSNKLRAYELQDKGMDTVEANLHLGFAADERNYGVGAQMLYQLGVRHMRLITNNPVKRAGLEGYQLTVEENIPIRVGHNQHNEFYLKTKKEKLGHNL